MQKILTTLLLTQFYFLSFGQHEFWGTVSNGGDYGHGYIFKTDSVGGNLEVIHHFDSIHGKNPSELLVADNNKIYGTTAYGGQLAGNTIYSGGTLYEYDLSTNTFKVLQDFGPGNQTVPGTYPFGDGMRSLTLVSNARIYGQVRHGILATGNIFSCDLSTGMVSLALSVPSFQGEATNSTQGNRLNDALYKSSDGYLYGTTFANSQCPVTHPYHGTIIRIDPVTNAFSTRYLNPCSAVDGYKYLSGFTEYNGRLYSVSPTGGSANMGVIYAFQTSTNTYVKKHDFTGGVGGGYPKPMLQAANGQFYGLAGVGGIPEPNLPSGGGILYAFDPLTDQFVKKLDFLLQTGSYLEVGPHPFSIINGFEGKLYGVTRNGVFSYDPISNLTHPESRFPVGIGWGVPESPSLTAVCRKPAYIPFEAMNETRCAGTDFSFVLELGNNTESFVWKHNGVVDAAQIGTTLSFENLTSSDAGSWVAELTNLCGTTVTPVITLAVVDHAPATIVQEDATLYSTIAATYQWIDCDQDMAPVAGATSSTFIPAHNGQFAVITTNNGCQDTSVCFLVDNLGLEQTGSKGSISVYPNPVTTTLHIVSDVPVLSLQVMNTSGQTILKGESDVLNVSELQSGTYFLLIKTEFGEWYQWFVK
ncbi:Gloeo_Verruco repeat protein [Fluviicola taffensis DSM 16823]|jgi:hypothetical protein|uniref:Gloeo_Verruco repeat protein n=2 Tax=Fluviicola TaxID=332102 RepID=F2IF30_FLUTR|nr:Gloeo_Verruco repeat protein [Fluviicola taffensis DSM 16823]